MLLKHILSYYRFLTPSIIQSSSSPAVPDYTAAAEATAKSNAEAMKAQTIANRPNIITPFGNQTWTNERAFDQAGYDSAMSNYNTQQAASQQEQAQPNNNGFGSLFGFDHLINNNNQTSAMDAPDRNSFYGDDNWTQTTTLSPESQKALDSQMAIQQGRSDTALGLMPRVNDAVNKPIDMSNFEAWGKTPTASNFQNMGEAPTLNSSLDTSNVPGMPTASNFQNVGSAPKLNTSLDKSGVAALPGNADSAFVQKYVDQANAYAKPQNERDQSNMDAKLLNMGLTPGSQAYSNAQRSLADQRSRNEFNSINVGMNQANQMYRDQLAANNQTFGQSLAEGQFGNTAMQNQNQMDLANTGFNNNNLSNNFAQQFGLNNQGYNQALSSGQFGNNAMKDQNTMNMGNKSFNNNNANTNFNQNMAASNYANTLRQGQYAEAQQEQLQPLNNLNALLNGQQVSMPNMPSFNAAGNAGGVNYSGAVNNQYQADLAKSNAQNASDAAMTQGLFGLGGAALGNPMMFG